MNEIKVKVTNDNVIVGGTTFNCDCLVIKKDNKSLQICFNKKDNISQYIGEDVLVEQNDGVYSIKRVRDIVHEPAKTSNKK